MSVIAVPFILCIVLLVASLLLLVVNTFRISSAINWRPFRRSIFLLKFYLLYAASIIKKAFKPSGIQKAAKR